MDEAKEVHTNLRNAAGIFKFVEVLATCIHSITKTLTPKKHKP